VAYERHATAGAPGEIVVFDLDTLTERTVLGDPALNDRRPDIDGNLVVWDVVTAAGDLEIVIHDPPAGLEFGSVNVGSSQMQIVTLSHLGGDLKVSGLFLDPLGSPGFSIGLSAPQTLARGDSPDTPVSFAPAAAGAATNTLIITTDAGTATLPRTGTFYVTVSEPLLGTGKFSGAYCVSLESSGNAWQTFRRR
jgi:hypothetical protein